MRTITLPGGAQQQIPDYAMALPFIAQEPTEAPDFILRETQIIADQNAERLVWWQGEVSDWTTQNTRNRQYNLPITAKPVQEASAVFHSITDVIKTLWFWQTGDGPLIGQPCPDLPALPTPSADVIIGPRLGDPASPFYLHGTWFSDSVFVLNPDGTRSQHQDQHAAGTQEHGTSSDGVTGLFLKWTTPFGGYWILDSRLMDPVTAALAAATAALTLATKIWDATPVAIQQQEAANWGTFIVGIGGAIVALQAEINKAVTGGK